MIVMANQITAIILVVLLFSDERHSDRTKNRLYGRRAKWKKIAL